MTPERVIPCPLCGREINVPPHTANTPFTQAQSFLMRRLQEAGIPYKVIAGMLGNTTAHSIQSHLSVLRRTAP